MFYRFWHFVITGTARVLFGDTLRMRRFSAMAMFAWVSSPENVPRAQLYSDQVPKADNGWAGQNYTVYSNLEVDKLIDAIEVETDAKKRDGMLREALVITRDQYYYVPLHHQLRPWAMKRNVTTVHKADDRPESRFVKID